MHWQGKLAVMSVAVIAALANQPLGAQGVGKYFAPKDQVVAIRAGPPNSSSSSTSRLPRR